MEEKSLLELVNNALEMLNEIKNRLEIDSQSVGENNDGVGTEKSKDDRKPEDLMDIVPQPSAPQQPAAANSIPESAAQPSVPSQPGSSPAAQSSAPLQQGPSPAAQSSAPLQPGSSPAAQSSAPLQPGSSPAAQPIASSQPAPAPKPAYAQPSAPVQSNHASGGIKLEFGNYSQTITGGGAFSDQSFGKPTERNLADNQPAISAARRPGPVPFASQGANSYQDAFSNAGASQKTAASSGANSAPNTYSSANAYTSLSSDPNAYSQGAAPGLSAEERAKAFNMPQAPAPSAFRFCKNCGSPIKPTAKFCRNCGERL